jgi:hypothetical protein
MKAHRGLFPTLAFIGIYITLIFLAAACPPAPPISGHHHHDQTNHDNAAHSVLCVWACQISSMTVLTGLHQAAKPTLLLIGLVLTASLFCRLPFYGRLCARAPPR